MKKSPLFPATSSLDALLTSGGDDRLAVDESMGLNKYGCSPFPENVAAYSYTTASSISVGAYMHVAAIYNELQDMSNNEIYDWAVYRFSKIKSRLCKIYGVSNDEKFIFGASGTDLELIALWTSFSKANKVNNIVVGAIETGSGINYVSQGQYYEDRTVIGHRVKTGSYVPGFERFLSKCTHIRIREADGGERDSGEITDEIVRAVRHSIGVDERPLIHIVHRSKTGLVQPDWENLKEALIPYSGKYDIVVDACQGRISAKKLNQYLDSQCMVLFTGSKFFGGPPFSGVIIVPRSLAAPISLNAPEGLAHFFTETELFDVSEVSGLCSSKINLGLILRWEAAMYEIERYFSLNQLSSRKVVDTFCDALNNFVVRSRLFSVLDSRDLTIKPSKIQSDPLDMDSIYTLEITPPKEYGIDKEYGLALDIYKSLNKDISHMVPRSDSGIGSFRIRLGQPVKSHPDNDSWKPTLRVSLGAPLISEIGFLEEAEIFKRFMSDFQMMERKADLILRMNSGCW